MKFGSSLCVVSALLGGVNALTEFVQTKNITLPDKDPWYNATGLDSKSNGEVLRIRDVPNPLANLSSIDRAYQVLFKSQDTFNKSIAAATTVIIPQKVDKHKVVTYLIPEDSGFIGCAPSYAMQQMNPDAALQLLVDAGVVLNVADHLGPNSAFAAGILEGHITLDSSIAVKNAHKHLGIAANPRIALWGYSGGSIAAGHANELLNDYAPDLEVAGVAMGGVVANLTAVCEKCHQGKWAGLVVAASLGLTHEYPRMRKFQEQALYKNASRKVAQAERMCVTEIGAMFYGDNVYDHYKDGSGFLHAPAVRDVLDSLQMGQKKPSAPMYIYQGGQDDIAPVQQVDKLVHEYCAMGVSVEYVKNPHAVHVENEETGRYDAARWVFKALNGGVDADHRCESKQSPISTVATAVPSDAPVVTMGGAGLNATASSLSSSSASAAAGTEAQKGMAMSSRGGGAAPAAALVAGLALLLVMTV